ncbi:hypothetical protein, partial [Acinetobacter sp.]|uniref:hypothetical protein n=1 Tax=Acinetobacter sp. TaxID=472 RepID=UPI002FC9EFF5
SPALRWLNRRHTAAKSGPNNVLPALFIAYLKNWFTLKIRLIKDENKKKDIPWIRGYLLFFCP